MSDKLESLILDLVEWVAKEPRAYADVMDTWRTSCPRLTVWEDAVDRGYLVRELTDGNHLTVVATPLGRRFLLDNGRGLPASGSGPQPPHLSKAASIGTR